MSSRPCAIASTRAAVRVRRSRNAAVPRAGGEVGGVGREDFGSLRVARSDAAMARSAALRVGVRRARAGTCERVRAAASRPALRRCCVSVRSRCAWPPTPRDANLPCRLSILPVDGSAMRSLSQQHQIVAVDDLVAAAPAEDRLDLVRAMAGDAFARRRWHRPTGRAPAPCRPGRAPPPDRRARTCPRRRARRPAAASGRRRARAPRRHRPTSAPSGASAPAIQRLRAERPSGAARNQVQRAPSSSAAQRTLGVAERDRHGAAGLRRDARRHQLGAHAAGGVAGRRLAAHRLDLRRDRRRPRGMCAAAGSRRGSAV